MNKGLEQTLEEFQKVIIEMYVNFYVPFVFVLVVILILRMGTGHYRSVTISILFLVFSVLFFYYFNNLIWAYAFFSFALFKTFIDTLVDEVEVKRREKV